MKKILLPLCLLVACSAFAASWGPTGHRITAEIAQRHLTDKAQKAIRDLAGPYPLAKLSTWADEIRSDPAWDFVKPWHYISVDEDETLDAVLKRDHKDGQIANVVEAIQFFYALLKGDADNTRIFEAMMAEHKVEPLMGSTRATALALLIHFVGDVHQPLHVGRTYDLGGNKIAVLWFGEKSNLHEVWDESMIEQQKLSYTEFVQFIDHPAEQDVRTWQSDGVEAWAQESIGHRKALYATAYQKTDFTSGLPTLSYEYPFKNLPVVKDRLLKGGVRLAALLNQAFG